MRLSGYSLISLFIVLFIISVVGLCMNEPKSKRGELAVKDSHGEQHQASSSALSKTGNDDMPKMSKHELRRLQLQNEKEMEKKKRKMMRDSIIEKNKKDTIESVRRRTEEKAKRDKVENERRQIQEKAKRDKIESEKRRIQEKANMATAEVDSGERLETSNEMELPNREKAVIHEVANELQVLFSYYYILFIGYYSCT
jgi:hypothetical protein